MNYPISPVRFGNIYGCNRNEVIHKTECYYYYEEQDMGAHIPCCRYHKKYGYCPCDNCEHYISKQSVDRVVREMGDELKD